MKKISSYALFLVMSLAFSGLVQARVADDGEREFSFEVSPIAFEYVGKFERPDLIER